MPGHLWGDIRGMGNRLCYSGVLHYLKAVALLGPAAARADGAATVAAMRLG